MKTAMLILAGLFFFTSAICQDEKPGKQTDPVWISKDIHKIQFRKNTSEFTEVRTSMSGLSISKQVQYISPNRSWQRSGKVRMSGMPDAVISKGIARMQYQNSRD